MLTVSTLTCGGYSVRPHQTLTVLLIYYIMSLNFEINGKTISHKDLNTVRDFFTNDQWDLIDYALSEYQDHEDATEKCKETLDVIYQLFRTSY